MQSPLTHLLAFIALAVALIGVSACSDETTPIESVPEPSAEPSCTAGFLGCACIDGTACFPGSEWICLDGLCQEPVCEAGTQGCACFVNNTCGNDGAGEPMLCQEGLCEVRGCDPGTIGCACGEGDACGEGLECAFLEGELICAPGGCEVGALDCPCGDARACNVGLTCVQSTCIVPGCRPGALDCFCNPDLSCDDGLQCNGDTERCDSIPCSPGSLGCECTENRTCAGEGAFCDAFGVCQEADCLAGQEGCACLGGTDCAATQDGVQLFCEDARCQRDDCVPGSPGCACIDGFECGGGSVCTAGICTPEDCTFGTEHCQCAGGACHPGLRCREDGFCVDGTGAIGGACLDNGLCDRGSRCSNELCVRCTLGSPGCACDDANTCFPGAQCMGALCVAESDIPPEVPDNPRCYSPCKQGATIDGVFVACGQDGLLEGCFEGFECVEGSCVSDGNGPRTCASEFDCPSFQTCIGGQCYAECDLDSDCSPGQQCDTHVCRTPCTTSGEACPGGQHCRSDDGENGVCAPTLPGDGDVSTVVPDTFTLTKTVLDFNNTRVTGNFQLINDSPTFQTFTIEKKDHLLQMRDGDFERARRAANGLIECDPEEDGDTCVCDEEDDCFCPGGDGCFCTDSSDCADGSHRCDGGLCRPATCTEGACPMFWVGLGTRTTDPEPVEAIEVGLESGAGVTIMIEDTADSAGVRWQGTLKVSAPELGVQIVNLSYSELPEGQWAGTMVYLADFGTRGVDDWRVDQTTRDSDLIDEVGNALIQRWGVFRAGRMSFEELEAVLTATQTGSWQFANVVEDCAFDACYMYDINDIGLSVFSNDTESIPVPSGVLELPVAMNLRQPDAESDPGLMRGRIESSKALQYAGNPEVELRFVTEPGQCDLSAFGACVSFLETMEANVLVGGRYLTRPGDGNCADAREGDGYTQVREPWLVPGFEQGTTLDDDTGLRYRYECRDSLLPLTSDDPDERAAFAPTNTALSISNPIPDGRARRRVLRLLDGALINQSKLVVLFEERFESFLGDSDEEGFSAYGFMTLTRRATDLNGETDYAGGRAEDARVEPEGVLAPECSEALLEEILGEGVDLGTGNLATVISAVIDGVPAGINPQIIDSGSQEQVHYLCDDTGLIDGGPANGTPNFLADRVPNNDTCGLSDNGVCEDGGVDAEFSVCALGTDRTDCGPRQNDDLDVRVECPSGSNVTFFTLDKTRITQAQIAALDCQTSEEGCADQVEQWRSSPIMVQEEPVYRCASDNQVFCTANRLDLRDGKLFYAAGEAEALFIPLQTLTAEAFRYKTRFQNRQGQGIGFAPTVCLEGGNLLPYCYEPDQIEEIQARVDCLLHIHQNHYDDLSTSAARRAARDKLDAYLETNFAFDEEIRPGQPLPVVHDGFERELAQLLIMLGDDSFTRAFASRFDLAGANTASFEGSLFEDDGINLSGAVGFEMFSLYQAAQYYQMVLDRFYTHSPTMWDAIGEGVDARNFVTPETVTRYLDRVIRASTQKSRTWGEIAERYHNLGRPDLARRVAERAYTATYLESIVMNRMMLDIVTVSLQEDRDQIKRAVEDAQRRYRASLLDMQDVHETIEDNITVFGFDPDFIPFPALDSEDFRQSNAFEVLLLRARNKMTFAREREDLALGSSREFETDQAQFQSELTSIRNNFENQLGDICGTFEGDDDRIYPAIKKYAHLSERTTLLGEPCGLVGNGQIFEAMASFEELSIEAQVLQVQYENVLAEADIERDRVSGQCREILEAADFLYGKCDQASEGFDDLLDSLNPFDAFEGNTDGCIQAQINDFQSDIRSSQFVINRLQQVQQVLSTTANLSKCSLGLSTDCPTAVVALGIFLTGTALTEAGISGLEVNINQKETAIADLERFRMKWQTENDCDIAKVDSEARVRTILLRLREFEVESLRLEYKTRLGLGELQRLRNLAKRLEIEQAETEQLTINVQAAHNNPNVRIYKNDAIINAEIAFDAAIREVFKLTRVFEYYTSTSYANKDDLYLIRMIARGDKNLENYVAELENTFFEFEEFFGHPSNRVELISLRDDIFAIPFVDVDGETLSDGERIERMRARLTDRSLLDRDGYLAIPFRTDISDLSPLTRNHKILRLEADIIGNDNGDTEGRLYIRQKGTSVIHAVDDSRQFHRFGERTAVVNTIFGGHRFFSDSIYQDFRLRDRPLVNTHWEMVINQRDEAVNQDINLGALTDIRIYIYYTDLTAF